MFRQMMKVGAGGAGLVLAFGLVPPAQADEQGVLGDLASVSSFSDSVATDVLARVADVPAREAGAAIMEATVDGVELSLPRDPESPIKLTTTGDGTIELLLPFSESAADANVETDGVVSYDNGNQSTTVPIVKDDGSVQITTLIEDASSPTTYEYGLVLPPGGSASLQDNGAVLLAAETGGYVGIVAPAWATDASGASVPTHYEIGSGILRQVVEHSAADTAYPVIADPWFGVNLIDRFAWSKPDHPTNHGRGWTISVAVTPMMALVNELVASTAGWDELVSRISADNPAGTNFPNRSYQLQWQCHSLGKAAIGLSGWLGIDQRPTWDLESWRREISVPEAWGGVIDKHCNW
ncbi:hypothetical protein EDF35_3350 [Rathayibacter sp. PhB151]|uniref:hypothetical protein n=1 Tax=Rathayibacter sp. PhB151 TaxID=2485189 RepID=UPI001063DBE5|nr:hypothetical protein [Rathayibacter sp. PhB151]TDX76658.1 hypothetical protein EDF35_3350 [Rathayibacter sp. PhB151]